MRLKGRVRATQNIENSPLVTKVAVRMVANKCPQKKREKQIPQPQEQIPTHTHVALANVAPAALPKIDKNVPLEGAPE